MSIDPAPNNAVSGAVVDMYSTPCRPFKFGTSKKPIQIDEDNKLSVTADTLSDLTNSQLVEKGPRKRLKLLRRVVHEADETQNTVVLSEPGFGSAEDSNMSQSSPASCSQNYLHNEHEE
jgi:hypothetical protein